MNQAAYVGELNEIFLVLEISYIDNTVTLENEEDDEAFKLSLDEVVLLDYIGKDSAGAALFENDLLVDEDEKLYMLEKDGLQVKVYEVDEKTFMRIDESVKVVSDLSTFRFYDNMLITLNEKRQLLDFIVDVVKVPDGLFEGIDTEENKESFTYMYACNNAEAQEIDLLTVVFVGLRKVGNPYTRTTLTHDEYVEYILAGKIVSASNEEFKEYVNDVVEAYIADRDTKGNKVKQECQCEPWEICKNCDVQ